MLALDWSRPNRVTTRNSVGRLPCSVTMLSSARRCHLCLLRRSKVRVFESLWTSCSGCCPWWMLISWGLVTLQAQGHTRQLSTTSKLPCLLQPARSAHKVHCSTNGPLVISDWTSCTSMMTRTGGVSRSPGMGPMWTDTCRGWRVAPTWLLVLIGWWWTSAQVHHRSRPQANQSLCASHPTRALDGMHSPSAPTARPCMFHEMASPSIW
mmetsp:Transcript_69061/g.144197  ORF Transcript_69061/g.144197 Transcript_69061/m.144197 type:complete len:209 (-) Transcript_69061:174-800(-)